jgi:RNA polymerase sigma-54 factor
MRLEYTQNLRLEQRLVQSPQMIQAMQVLQLTTPELLDRIEAELEDNPFLETASQAESDNSEQISTDAEPDSAEKAAQDENTTPEAGTEEPVAEEIFGIDEPLLEAYRGEGPAGRTAGGGEEEFDPLQNLAAPEELGTRNILSELRVDEIEASEIEHAGLLLTQLDERGFLPNGLDPLAKLHDVPIAELELALEDLRDCSHPALGAADLRECFLLQLEAQPGIHQVAETLVREHFEELLANKLPLIAHEMDVDLDTLRLAIEDLSYLDSRPLFDYTPDNNVAISPDLIVEEVDGEYVVRLVREGLPELRLSQAARIALDKAKGDKRLHGYLMKKLERARWFLDAVNHRRESLMRIATAIVQRQREFLDYGPEKLRPLKMQEIADAVNVHISTVSRAIRGKHAQTPQGILSLKSFFSGGQRTSRGGQRSRVSIQERIKTIVDSEDRRAPLSDEEIGRVLRERDGIKVARRTITKYRKAMAIPSSTMRKSF